jgi:coenzyme Q-binding protein COQ10
MPTHAEQRTLPYTLDQLFDLVADVERYPDFLPWCLGCHITEQLDKNSFRADLTIGYKFFRETFISEVHLTPKTALRVNYINGPMRNLSNKWTFIDNHDGTTTIDFFIDFEFHNRLLGAVMDMFFNEAFRRMVAAFESRAHEVYG